MTEKPDDAFHFEGEEAGSGFASPALDFVATGLLVALSIAVMIASVALPVPGGLRTAPGLLPFITAASLLLMALALGWSAWMRHRSGVGGGLLDERDLRTDLRSIGLAAAVAAYIAALQFLAFQKFLTLGPLTYTISAFEPVTVVALSAIIAMSWKGPLWITVLVSVVWTLILSVVFQHVFSIPLPGSF
jgi:hypothetical protein